MAALRRALALGLISAGCTDEADIHLLEPAERPIVLMHRYDFAGVGTTVVDRAGDADGEIVGGAVLAETGALELDGVDDYVNLPNDIFGDSSAVSLVAWVTWRGARGVEQDDGCWQRVFDLGSSVAGEDMPRTATSSVFVTPASCEAAHIGPVTNGVLSTMFHAGPNAQMAQDAEPLPVDREVQVALTLDATAGLRLYLDAELIGEIKGEMDPRLIECENDWLGRSQWVADAMLFGSFSEFRVYRGALSEEDVARTFERGPDAP